MSGWNYRVVSRTIKTPSETHEFYAIYEVFYSDDDRPNASSVTPTYPCGDSLEELTADMAHYMDALKKPVLRYEDIK